MNYGDFATPEGLYHATMLNNSFHQLFQTVCGQEFVNQEKLWAERRQDFPVDASNNGYQAQEVNQPDARFMTPMRGHNDHDHNHSSMPVRPSASVTPSLSSATISPISTAGIITPPQGAALAQIFTSQHFGSYPAVQSVDRRACFAVDAFRVTPPAAGKFSQNQSQLHLAHHTRGSTDITVPSFEDFIVEQLLDDLDTPAPAPSAATKSTATPNNPCGRKSEQFKQELLDRAAAQGKSLPSPEVWKQGPRFKKVDDIPSACIMDWVKKVTVIVSMQNLVKYQCKFPVTGGCCRRLFGRSSGCCEHIKSHHLGIKPFQCQWPGCGYASVRMYDTDRHCKYSHLPVVEVKCSKCEAMLSRPDVLRSHMEAVHGEKLDIKTATAILDAVPV